MPCCRASRLPICRSTADYLLSASLPMLSLLRMHAAAGLSSVHRAWLCHVTQSACTAAPCRDAVKGLADMAALQRLTVPCYACSHRWVSLRACLRQALKWTACAAWQ